MIDVNTDLAAELRAEVGSTLRTVATHHEQEYEFQYLRDDIEDEYSPDDIQEIFDDLVLEGMERDHFEQLFHAGTLEYGAWGFEDAAIFYFPGEEYSGLVVSVDRDGPIDIDALIETCKSHIDDGPAA